MLAKLPSFSRGSLAASDAMADNGYLFTLDHESSDNDENDDCAFQRSDSFTVQMCPTYVQRMRAMAQSKVGSTKRKQQSKPAPVTAAVVKQASGTSGVSKWFTSLMTRSQSVSELRTSVSAQRVRYIFGSTPTVKWRKRSLNELQQPLLDAYSSYMLGRCSSAPAEVRILKEGVRVRYYASPEAGRPFEFLGDFCDLAHYAALRCVVEQSPRTVAFVPFGTGLLETAPELVATCVVGAPKMVGDVAEELMSMQNHPPLFVCLMRSSMEKALRCHMFVCSSAEQAVAIAREVRNVMVSTMTRKRSNDEGCGSGTGVRRWETFLRSLVGGTARKDKSRVCPFIADRPKGGVPRSRSFVHVNRVNRDMLSGCDVLECNNTRPTARVGPTRDAKDGSDQHRLTKEAEIQFTIEELKVSTERENNDWEEEWGRSSFLP